MDKKGKIKDENLSQLLVLVEKYKFSGHILFKRESIEKKLYFKDGIIKGSSSNDPTDYLGQYFINEGIVSLEQFNRAYKTELETDVKMGQILNLIGLISPEKLKEGIITKIVDTAFIISWWEKGEYEFFDKELPASEETEVFLTRENLNSYLQGRQKEVVEMIKMFQQLGNNPEISILDKNIEKLKKVEQQIVTFLSIGKSLREMFESLPVHFYMISRYLYSLYKEGVLLAGTGKSISEQEFFEKVVSYSGYTKPMEMKSISSEELVELYKSAKEYLEQKEYWKAASFFRILHSANPHNIVFRDALLNAEYLYIVDFYKNKLKTDSKISKKQGTGIISDPLEEKILEILERGNFKIIEITTYFKEDYPEIKILKSIERLLNKGYLVEAK